MPHYINKPQTSAVPKNQRFDNWDSFGRLCDAPKVKIFQHPAENIVMLAAKDTGKSTPVNWYKIYGMELDPKANVITLQKYSTAAARKGIRSMTKAINEIKSAGFKLKRVYAPTTGAYYRLPAGKASTRDQVVRLNSQIIDFDSFEDSNRIADYALPNGGYPFLIHMEEPVLQNDSNTVSDQEWLASYKTIKDSVRRAYLDYQKKIKLQKQAAKDPNYVYDPLPFKIICTLNDWDPEHYLSKMFRHYFPEHKFIDWVLGINYSQMLEMWKDKIDGVHPVVPIQKQIDANWDVIKTRLLTHHTQSLYLEKNNLGETIDLLLVRMQKFANPRNRQESNSLQETYEEMYAALVTGDSLGLAKAFGTSYDGSSMDEKRFNFDNLVPYSTLDKLQDPFRRVRYFAVGVDHDVNRGIVLTPTTASSQVIGNRLDGYKEVNYQVMIHPQVVIPADGKGTAGEKTKAYHAQLVDYLQELYTQYVTRFAIQGDAVVIFDDDDGSYTAHLAEDIYEIGYTGVDTVHKQGKIEDGGYGIDSRDEMIQNAVNLEEIIIDRENKQLLEFLKRVPRVVLNSGRVTRNQQGKWGTYLKDYYDSMAYSIYHLRAELYNGINNV